MTFNEFQKELRNKGIEPRVAYFLSLLFEAFVTTQQRQDDSARALLDMAKALEQFVALNDQTQARLMRVERMGRPDGIEVASVINEPED